MSTLTFAVFGDIHGAFDEMFNACLWYEEKHNTRIDYILQTGDFGIWTEESQFDRATLKFMKDDISELGASVYIKGKKKAPIPVIFIPGNHEDFEIIKRCRNSSIDLS